MKIIPALLLMASVAACSALPVTGDGIVALEIRTKPPVTIRLGASLTLRARALNLQGDSVSADIRWLTADTAAVALDSITGVVVARVASGTARVQAHVGTLRSDLLTIALLP